MSGLTNAMHISTSIISEEKKHYSDLVKYNNAKTLFQLPLTIMMVSKLKRDNFDN